MHLPGAGPLEDRGCRASPVAAVVPIRFLLDPEPRLFVQEPLALHPLSRTSVLTGVPMFQTYGKSIVAALYAVAIVAIPLVTGDNHVDAAEGVTIATAIATAALTYLV